MLHFDFSSRAAASLLLVVGLALPSAPAFSELADPSESELLLLQVRLGRQHLHEVVPAYRTAGVLLLPLGELAGILELDVEVDPVAGRAAGAVLGQGRELRFDGVTRSGSLGGQPLSLEPREVEVRDGDLYLSLDALSDWLPLDLLVDERSAILTVLPREPLPRQLREERARRGGRLGGLQDAPRPYLPRLDPPRALLRRPGADLRLQGIAGSDTESSLHYSVAATGDLLWLDSYLHFSGSQDGLSDEVRFILGRRDPAAGLLGPLRATEATLGHLYHPGVDLVTLGRAGPGILVSNIPLERPTHFDRHTLRGELPAGWEVELYRDGALLAHQASRGDGLYELADIPLTFGTNRFELVFYGPYGEERREIHVVEVGGTLMPAGELQYRLGGNDPRLGEPRGHLELGYGLTPRLSAAATFSRVEEADGEWQDVATLGLRGSWGRLFATLDGAADVDGGHAVKLGLQSRIGRIGVLAQHTELEGFQSEAFLPRLGPVSRRTLLRLDGVLPGPWGGNLPVSLSSRRDAFVDGGSITETNARMSMSRGRLLASNQLRWSLLERDGRTDHDTVGTLALRRFGHGISWRGEAGYRLHPESELVDLSVRAERRLGGGYFVAGGLRHSLRSESTRVSAELARRQGAFGYGLLLDYSEMGGLRTVATLSVGSSPVPDSLGWHTDAQPLSATGSVIARAFLDLDGDGVLGPGDELLEGVGFTVDGSLRRDRSDPEGRVLLSRLTSYREVDIALATRTLEDPLWIPASEGVRVVPRPGTGTVIDFPVMATGEIDGTVSYRQGGVLREAPGIRIQLVGEGGAVAMDTRSAFDGYYLFSRIRPGAYTLRADPEQVERLGVTDAPSREVVIEPIGDVLDGIDLVLELPEQPAPTAAPTGAQEAAEELPLLVVQREAGGAPTSRPSPSSPPSPPSPAAMANGALLHGVQLGAFRSQQAAEGEARRLAAELAVPCVVIRAEVTGLGTWYRVVAGGFGDAAAAGTLRSRLAAQGVEVGPVLARPADRPVARPEAARVAARTNGEHRAPGGDTPTAGRDEAPTARAASPPPAGAPPGRGLSAKPRPQPSHYVLQVASLPDEPRARELARALASTLGVGVQVRAMDLGERGRRHRLLVGPFASSEEARRFGQTLPAGMGLEAGPVSALAPPQGDSTRAAVTPR